MRALALLILLVAVSVQAADRQTQTTGGRWQIINPTPDAYRNVMLLDTQTGEVWVVCSGDGASGWCKMPKWDATRGTATPAPATWEPSGAK